MSDSAGLAVASKGLDTRKQPYKPRLTGKGRIRKFEFDDDARKAGWKSLKNAEVCGTRAFVWEHKPCGARWAVGFSCNTRICTRCSRRRARRAQRRYAHAVASFRHPALVTLTVPNARTGEELAAALGVLLGGFRELRRRKVWPSARGLWTLEVTWSAEGGFHPHLHVVCDLAWVESFDALAAEWQRLTGARHQPDVKRAITDEARAGLLREGIKYITKAWELPKEALHTVASLLAGRRLVQPFGGVRAEKEEPLGGVCCPKCEVSYDPRLYDKDWLRDWVNVEDLGALATGPRWADWSPDGWSRKDASTSGSVDFMASETAARAGRPPGG